jgi:peptidoglycan hydrolase CwlO-like protein
MLKMIETKKLTKIIEELSELVGVPPPYIPEPITREFRNIPIEPVEVTELGVDASHAGVTWRTVPVLMNRIKILEKRIDVIEGVITQITHTHAQLEERCKVKVDAMQTQINSLENKVVEQADMFGERIFSAQQSLKGLNTRTTRLQTQITSLEQDFDRRLKEVYVPGSENGGD